MKTTPSGADAASQVERLDVENHRLRRAMQKIMARLTDLLDEDQFGNVESIVTEAGVEPPEPGAQAPLLARIAELEAKLAEAQKDAARLDYVATGKVTVSRDNGGFQLAWYDHNSQKLKWQNSWHETARAAIDAAMAQEDRND